MEVLKEKEMKLLSRKRMTVLIKGAVGTPSRKSMMKDLAKKFNTKEDNIIVKHIYPQFGNRDTKVIVHVYEDTKKLKIFEHGNLLKKHSGESKEANAEEKEAKSD